MTSSSTPHRKRRSTGCGHPFPPASAALGLACLLIGLALACSPADTVRESTPDPAAPRTDRAVSTAGRVAGVVDAVTIDVELDGRVERVRYLGIEVPQGELPGRPGRPVSQEALEFNRFLVDGRTVELERDGLDADGAGRLLRYVYVNGEMVNEALLSNGYAVVSGAAPAFRRRDGFLATEDFARQGLRGVWEPAQSVKAAEDEPQARPVVQEFSGGTLPSVPGSGGRVTCDFSGTDEQLIKGNYDSQTGERTYHVPGGFFYATTVVTENDGDRWFCTEEEALLAGWKPSKH